ncbi:MAG TPA: type II toxin-antitoxin system HigB family toxin [Chitinophagales bacterium]|nr:type II toxin-antitoxin system HigB family toxin [Chitinophagales bacterium]
MRVIAKGTLKKFWEKYPEAERPLLSWHKLISESEWGNPAELKRDINSASVVGNNRVVFNIKGNDYRLVTSIDFKFGLVFIIWIGTHKQYDKIDVKTIGYDKGN